MIKRKIAIFGHAVMLGVAGFRFAQHDGLTHGADFTKSPHQEIIGVGRVVDLAQCGGRKNNPRSDDSKNYFSFVSDC